MLAPGAVIAARYRLDRIVGQGGMGVIWAAEDLETHERRALKAMKPASGDPDAHRRFLHEARAAARVRHPNVVRIFDVLEPEAASPIIVMELLDGETLRGLLERQHDLAAAELVEILLPVVSAVGAAHALGIVHRDLKPENIFLARGPAGERTVKVLDFGIAKLVAVDLETRRGAGLTTSAVLGTPAYMAPEQVFGERDVDHRADIWALGVILYECTSGVRPTDGDNIGQVLKHVLQRPFRALGELVPGVDPALAALVARMLARDRAHRPADLDEVHGALAGLATAPGPPVRVPPRRAARPGARLAMQTTVPAQGSGRRRAAIGGAALLAMIGAAGAWRSRAVAPIDSPLAAPHARLGCPVLRASGVTAPAGWLGAAAAAMACERARLVLGGRTERTLAPAELLDLPRGPADAFPADPYGAPDARSRTLAAAAHRAQAYLDGEVAHSAAGFEVALSLRRADGVELASGAGRGRGLYEAVRAAMAPLIRVRRIPAAPRLPPEVAAWSRTQRIDDALAALDLTFAFVQSAGGLPAECARFEALAARLGELGLEGQQACAYTLGRPAPVAAPGRSDDSAAGRALQIRIDHAVHQTVRPGDPAFLRDQLAREPTPRGRSLLAAIESCVIGSTDADAARERAIAAVQSEPSNPEGGTCNPWEQLMTLERNTRDAGAAMRAMQAWVPWNSYAWLEPAFATEGADPQALALVARAHALSPLDTQIADVLARGLLAAGDRAAARGIAAELAGGGLVVHDVERELILVRVETSEARFAAALARARKASELAPGDTGWIRAQRFEIAWHAIELAALVGRAPDVADEVVARFVDPDPTPLDANLSLVPMRIPAICALASTPARCFARFRALRPQLPGAITRDTDDFLAGAERYAERDLAGAARAWRPLISGPRLLAAMLPDAMVDAFEHTGAADLAAAVDQEVTRRAGEFGGATLGHVRAARRALARGDLALARQLAQQVTDAWSTADEPPPALAEMRQLLEAAPPGRREP